MAFRLRRSRTTCLTVLLLVVGMFIVLNVFFAEVNSGVASFGNTKYLADSADQVKTGVKAEKSNLLPEFQVNFAAQGQRKPKTMNLENGSDEDEDNDDPIDANKSKNRPKKHKTKDLKGVVNDLVSNSHQDIEDIQDLDDDYEEEEDDDDDDDYYYDDEYNPNPVFKPGDFGDIRGLEYFKKPKLKFETVKSSNVHKSGLVKSRKVNMEKGRNGKGGSKPDKDVIQNGMYWSSAVESAIPKGLSYRNITQLLNSLHKQTVQTLDDPTWDRCGRPKNGFIILSDGTQMCVRYRHPHMHFVFGEALSFYLSRLLGMDSVPAVVLATTGGGGGGATSSSSSLPTSRQWRAVNISSLEWEEGKVVAFIQWIDNLNSGHRSRAHIPALISASYNSGSPVQAGTVYRSLGNGTTVTDLAELAQWGTMIVFDYLTGNYDRVASMQDAADKDNNPQIMDEPIRNLRKSSQTKKLWLIDNESGLFDAYELLEPYKQNSRFTKFHIQMLQTMCVFQSTLVNALYKLAEQSSPHLRLLNFASSLEPLMKYLPKDQHYDLFVSMFENRLHDVISWIEKCKQISHR